MEPISTLLILVMIFFILLGISNTLNKILKTLNESKNKETTCRCGNTIVQ